VALGDSIRMGLSDALHWAADKAEAGAKMVSEVITETKDAVVKTAEAIVAPAAPTIKETPKPASLATTVQGVNSSSFTDKIAYAWKKTTEMTSALGTYAAMLTPVGAGVVVASKLINLGNNTYQNKETGDRVQILDKDKSITSMLSGSAWQTALGKGAEAKGTAPATSIDTDKLKSNLPGEPKDNSEIGSLSRSRELTAHVDSDQWKRILNDNTDASGVVPDATVTKDSITFNSTDATQKGQEAEVKVGPDKVTHDDKKGNTVEFDAKAQRFLAHGEKGTTVDVNRSTGNVEATDNGKGYRVVDGKKIWDVNDNQTVEFENGAYKVYDRSHNLIQQIEKGKVTDFRGKDKILRYTGTRKIQQEWNAYKDQRQADSEASGLVLGAAEDGIFMRDKDGTAVVLQTDGNAFFELPGGVKIWKDIHDKYFIVEAGKEPQPILEGTTGKASEAQAKEVLGQLKGWAEQNTFTRDGVKFTNANGKVNVEMDDGRTKLQAGPESLVLTLPDRAVSTLNTLTNKVTIGEGKDKTTIDPIEETVDTPWVRSDKLGTTIKKTGDWVGNNLEVKLADGTHYTPEGDVQFADGTAFHKNGDVTTGDNVRLAADIQERQITQAATVLRNAEVIAEAAKAKAASGLINYDLIAQLDGSIAQVGTLMQMFSGNDTVRARLVMVLATLEAARGEAQTSFAANTALRATRDAALAGNKVKPESVVLSTAYNPELKMQFRFKADRSAA